MKYRSRGLATGCVGTRFFSGHAASLMLTIMDGHSLPPDFGQFAAGEVAAGRYSDRADVLRAAMDLLKRHQQARAGLLHSVLAAQREGDRSGFLAPDDVAAHVRATIARKAAVSG